MERRDKLFQKCPVTPAKVAALFGGVDDAGWSYISAACDILYKRLPYISPYGPPRGRKILEGDLNGTIK